MSSSSVILASKSPRRENILKQIGIDFEIIPSNICENAELNLSPRKFVQYWSGKKAKVISKKNKDKIVIGADTIVYFKGKIIGKPKDKEESYKMLNNLSGKTHKVFTGVSIVYEEKNILRTFCQMTKVTVRDIPKNDILYYIDNYYTLDKAGSYGIQDWFSIWIKKIDGCYYNVMGLPLSKFYKNYLLVKNN
tara:strand:+ start:822 stop:1397 length:576 start_codon:yes stop_codon:yes gene_type:complete